MSDITNGQRKLIDKSSNSRRPSSKMLSSAKLPKKVQIIEMSGSHPPVLGPATTALLMKTQFGLVIRICAVAAITTWSNYVVGAFKLRHPEVYGIDDAGVLMFDRVGWEVFGLLSTSIGLNAVSAHGTCTAVFVTVAAIVLFDVGRLAYKAVSAVLSITFAYCGTPIRILAVYLTVGAIMYYYCGFYAATPALGSAGPLIKKISYGISLPEFSSNYVIVRIMRGTDRLVSNSITHWVTWLGCTLATTMAAYLIASGIPIFGDLVSLIGALLGTFMSFLPKGCMWLFLVGWSVLVIVLGFFLMISGTYGYVLSIIASSKTASGSSAWSCVDNSNS
ncbi:hypothetical protein BDW42DRAFT_188749 [Aspergillus taichungensis]|uniref:Amino acid transporter transmembrane domain-containing protein n=1 Tax=Aspergillus taichungensis TaxID=482145 RepID=A0A2J5HH68_9EURO|nr:hypothetical protein BDW42DRAFT_188749 [Aspergillus taichungensis]